MNFNITSTEYIKNGIQSAFINHMNASEFLERRPDEWTMWTISLNWNQETGKVFPVTRIWYLDTDGKSITYKEFSRSSDSLNFIKSSEAKDFSFSIGKSSERSCRGYFRNFIIIKDSLTDKETRSIFKEGFRKTYSFPSDSRASTVESVIKNGEFFVGLIGSYDNDNVNILNCVLRNNGKSIRKIEKEIY